MNIQGRGIGNYRQVQKRGEGMTNKEAIEIIKNYDVNGCGYCHQGDKEIEEAFDMAIHALEQTRWIPVSEKLPEEGLDVLACFYNGEGNYKMMVSRRSDYNYWSGVGRTADMVAWMPLPKPYKGVSEE